MIAEKNFEILEAKEETQEKNKPIKDGQIPEKKELPEKNETHKKNGSSESNLEKKEEKSGIAQSAISAVPATVVAPNEKQKNANENFDTFEDENQTESLDGAHAMPKPQSPRHQRVAGNLYGELYLLLKGKPCNVFHAPFDVRLNPSDKNDPVVQPDILVICDRSKIGARGCKGAPDLIIEVISLSTAKVDNLVKQKRYREAKVKEYWIVDPHHNIVQVLTLKDAHYISNVYGEEDTIPLSAIENCNLDLKEIFKDL